MNNHRDLQEEPFSGRSGGFNFKLLFNTVLANWFWFLAAVCLGLGIAYFYLKYSTPMYAATARILISADGKEAAGQTALLEELGGLVKTNSEI